MKYVSIAAALVLLTGCGASPAEDTPGCQLSVQWGTGDPATFVPLRNGDTASAEPDASGQRFVNSTLRLSGTTAPETELRCTVTVDGYQTDEEPPDELSLAAGPDGARYVSGLRVPAANVPAAEHLSDTQAIVVLQAQAGGCASYTATWVRLTDQVVVAR